MTLTRRAAMLGAAGALAKASQSLTPVAFDVPANACDCHTHIFDPDRFPFWTGRSYTPPPALPAQMAAFHRALHIRRVVIVTASVYGTDNAATLFGMKARGKDARGIAVIDEKTPEGDLDAMDVAGVRGIRLNLATAGQSDLAAVRSRLQAAILRVEKRNWHIQIFADTQVIPGIKDLVLDSAAPFVFDHFGGVRAAPGLEQPGFADLIRLLRSGKAYVKISGAYRVSTHPPDYPDAAPFARALIAANPDRVLWGTDWPHPDAFRRAGQATEVRPPLPIDDGRLLNQLPIWAPDPAVRAKILVDNPSRLYGF